MLGRRGVQNKTRTEAEDCPRVVMVELPACPVDPAWDALERERRPWWHHQRRNAFVARLARALALADTETLRASGIRLSAGERRRARKGWRVAVLVESARHGAAVLEFLPRWVMLDAVADADEGDAAEGKRKPAHSTAAAAPQGKVVTLARAWKDTIDADVLVRATGGRGRLLLDGAVPHGVEVEAAAGLVIDFADNSDAGTVRDTACRRRDYRQQGLTV